MMETGIIWAVFTLTGKFFFCFGFGFGFDLLLMNDRRVGWGSLMMPSFDNLYSRFPNDKVH
jgi:hypothetical protein